MSGIKIDGKKISQEMGEEMFLELQEKKLVGKISLGILCVGDDPASLSFIHVKKKFGEKYGFVVNIRQMSEPGFHRSEDYTDFREKIIFELKKLQSENSAVIVQLPMPGTLREFTGEILSFVQKEKDVDNLNSGIFLAPIVLALEQIFSFIKKYQGETTVLLKQKVFGIVGLGQVVGLPIYEYLKNCNFRVIKVGRENFEEIKKCDVVIAGVGEAGLIEKDVIKDGSILIDYGCSYVKLNGESKICGDFAAECYEKSSYYTPVPGCMGPLVVASLFKNVLKSYSS